MVAIVSKPAHCSLNMEEVFDFAAKAHDGQVDMAGQPYIYHVNRVASAMNNQKHQRLGLLHDVMEDTDYDDGDLFKFGIPLDEIAILKLLTHKKDDSYEAYIDTIGTDFDATMVKLADLRDNMDLLRLPKLTGSDFKRIRKYHKAFHTLLKRAGEMMQEDEEAANGTKGQ